MSPSTATEPSASQSVSSSRIAASIASGTAPPNIPECEACASVSMRRLNATAPRSATVMAGVSRSQLPESATTIASAASRSRFSCRKLANELRQVLLLALDEQRDAEVEVGAEHLGERADGADVRHDAGLVVGGAAAVEAVAALRRLERRRLPVLLAARAAARRGARTAARSVARCGAARCATTAGRPSSGSSARPSPSPTGARRTSTRSNTPRPRTSSATASAALSHVRRIERRPRHRGDLHEAGEVGDRRRGNPPRRRADRRRSRCVGVVRSRIR